MGATSRTAAEVGSLDVITVSPGDPVAVAMERLIEESVEHLPVVDEAGRVVGMCTRTDIIRARTAQTSEERRQPAVLLRTLVDRGTRRPGG